MKSIIAAVITCMILFGSSYAASLYFMQQEPEPEEVVEPLPETADQSSTLPPNGDGIRKVDVMPVAHRPEKSVSLEAVLQMSDSIKKMEEKLIIREQRVAKEEQRINLLFTDLATERAQLEAFREAVDTKVESLGSLRDEVREILSTLDKKQTELAKLEKNNGLDAESQMTQLDDKVNGVKGWFANLEPEQASKYLKEFANNGKLNFAATLLHKMPDRQKSKILGALNDPVLVDQLIDALKVKPRQ